MKPARFLLVATTVLSLWAVPAAAQRIVPALPDPAAESRAHAIDKSLRCLVCQNQTIADSNADLAIQLRQIVRERIVAGDNDEQVRQFVVARYGDWVLMRPPFNLATALLWISPAILLIVGGIAAVLFLRRQRRRSDPAVPLSAEEQARLATLLRDKGPA